VKQARPFRLAGPGHGYAKAADARASAVVRLTPRLPNPRSGDGSKMQRQESFDLAVRLWRRRSSAICHLTSAAAWLRPARLGLGVGELDEKGIW
jgi:hypothetical protein